MEENEFIKIAKFLDDNGAFSVADELENDFVKVAQADQKFIFPLPKSRPGYLENYQDQLLYEKKVPTIDGKYPIPKPAYEYSSFTGEKAPSGFEFSPKGIPQPLGTGDQWYAQRLFESLAPYSNETGPQGISASDYWQRLNPGKKLKVEQEFSPKGFLQSKGWGEASAAMKVFKSFPNWKPRNLSKEAQNILIKKSLIEAPKEKPADKKQETPSVSKPTPATKTEVAKPSKKQPRTEQTFPKFELKKAPLQVAQKPSDEDSITFED